MARWPSPLVAAVFAVLLLAFAGIPLTSGSSGKFAVFKDAVEGVTVTLVLGLAPQYFLDLAGQAGASSADPTALRRVRSPGRGTGPCSRVSSWPGIGLNLSEGNRTMRGTTVLPGTPCTAPAEGVLPMHRLEVPMPNALPFASGSFDTIGPMSRAAFPHRHTFYEIVHVTAGTGTHVLDLARWELRPPHLCVISPGQVHHWEDAEGLDGTVVLFTEDFLLDHPGDRDVLRGFAGHPWLTLDRPEHERTGRLLADLQEEYRRGADGFESVLRALLHILVVRAARLPAPAPPPPRRRPAPPGRVPSRRCSPGCWPVPIRTCGRYAPAPRTSV